MTSANKVFLAFFYPWSNTENSDFLSRIQLKAKDTENIYLQRSTIIRSLEGRPV